MTNRYWAVGFKGWVEVRASRTPPKAVKSVMETEVEERKIDYDNYFRALKEGSGRYSSPTYKIVKKIKEFPCTFYDGGKVVKVITANKFRRLTGFSVGSGNMVELNDATVEAVKRSREHGNAE